eukprot:7237992-Alexandrium_andersonii.AAC.1
MQEGSSATFGVWLPARVPCMQDQIEGPSHVCQPAFIEGACDFLNVVTQDESLHASGTLLGTAPSSTRAELAGVAAGMMAEGPVSIAVDNAAAVAAARGILSGLNK